MESNSEVVRRLEAEIHAILGEAKKTRRSAARGEVGRCLGWVYVPALLVAFAALHFSG